MDEPTYTFGWRGFRFRVPEPWEPGHLEGDDAKGYARLDDSLRPRVELRWEKVYRPDALDRAVDRYVAELERQAAGKKSPLKLDRPPKEVRVVTRWPEKMRGRTVRWSGEVDCVAGVMACSACDRLTAIQVIFPRGELRMAVARELFGSFRDHAEDPDAPVLWSLYKMRFETPARWRVRDHKFGPGYAEVRFAGPGRLAVDVRRWGPAEVFLRRADLATWYAGQFRKGIRVDKDRFIETEVRGDRVLMLTREPKGLMARVRRRARGDVGKRFLALQSLGWHCPSTNRLWIVDAYAPTLEAAEEAEWQVFCHEDGAREAGGDDGGGGGGAPGRDGAAEARREDNAGGQEGA